MLHFIGTQKPWQSLATRPAGVTSRDSNPFDCELQAVTRTTTDEKTTGSRTFGTMPTTGSSGLLLPFNLILPGASKFPNTSLSGINPKLLAEQTGG